MVSIIIIIIIIIIIYQAGAKAATAATDWAGMLEAYTAKCKYPRPTITPPLNALQCSHDGSCIHAFCCGLMAASCVCSDPAEAAAFTRQMAGELPADWKAAVTPYKVGDPDKATRQWSEMVRVLTCIESAEARWAE